MEIQWYHRELAYELHAWRLRNAHQLKQPELLDLHLISGLERLNLLKPQRDFSSRYVELGAGSDDLPGLSEDQLLLRRDDEGVLQIGGGF